MSVYSVNNPLSNGYGLNVYSIKKKLVEEENTDSQNPADILSQNGSQANTVTASSTKLTEKEFVEWETLPQSSQMTNEQLAVLVEQIADEIGINGKITYSALIGYRDGLSADFQETVKNGLAELGVAQDADFRLSLDENGELQVSSNHKDKEKIEQFFKENPELAESYEKIQTLNLVEQARQNSGISLSDAYEKANLLSYTSGMLGTNSALAMTGSGSLASLLNTGFCLTV